MSAWRGDKYEQHVEDKLQVKCNDKGVEYKEPAVNETNSERETRRKELRNECVPSSTTNDCLDFCGMLAFIVLIENH